MVSGVCPVRETAGLAATVLLYFLSRKVEAPEVILLLSLVAAVYQYIYLPGKMKS